MQTEAGTGPPPLTEGGDEGQDEARDLKDQARSLQAVLDAITERIAKLERRSPTDVG